MTKGKDIMKNKTFEKTFGHTYGKDGKCIYCGYEKHTDKAHTKRNIDPDLCFTSETEKKGL